VRFLADPNVLSEPTKPHPNGRVLDWLRQNERALTVNPIILGEMEYGILLLPDGTKRRKLEEWFAAGRERLSVLDFDKGSATAWAELLARLKRNGLSMPIKDSLIAATALAHDLTVATRNLSDFQHAGVSLVNPFEDAN